MTQTIQEQIRDVRIMARRGETFDFICNVMGWRPSYLAQQCEAYGIAITGKAPGLRSRNQTGRPVGRPRVAGARRAVVYFSTTDEIHTVLAQRAAARGVNISHLVDDLLQAVARRGLWDNLLRPERDA